MPLNSSRPPPWYSAAARDAAWVVVISVLPLVLLGEPRQQYGTDWITNLWLTAYYGEFFQHHHAFPEVIHTIQLAGIPYPVFYGFLLYPLLGLISSFTDPHAALRLAVGAVFLLQTWQVLRLMDQAGANRLFGRVTAALACWSTYALTNLYNRGAVSELIATTLLTAAICAVYRACLLPPGPTRWPPLATGLLCLVLAAGTHPITGVFGGMFFALMITVAWAGSDGRGQLAAWLGAGAIIVASVLSPWIYAVLKFGPALYVTQLFMAKLQYYPGNIDSLATRLMPFPYDRRVMEDPNLSVHQTPHLDAQVTVGLVILAVFLAACCLGARSRRLALNRAGLAIAITSWISFFGLLVISVSPALGARLPDLFHKVQFAYRLVTYLNLSLLLVVVGSLMALSSAEARKLVARRAPLVLWATLALAVCGLALKLQHGWAHKSAAPKVSGSSALTLPVEFYGYYAYAVTSHLDIASPGPSTPLSLTVGRGPEFGWLAPEKINSPAQEFRLLKVQAFPWNEVLLNGRPAVTADTVNAAEGATITLPAGENEITYAWRPDRLWVRLNILSRGTLLALLILVVVLHGRMILRDAR